MVRSSCARLAVLFFALASATVTTTAVRSAFAGSGCVTTPTGIECDYSGSTTSTMTATTPPLRYLVTANDPVVGPCWYWSPYPPGLDSWDSANDAAIINTRWALPACPTETASTTTTTTSTAWEVFRSFDLSRPSPVLRPVVGITNLPTLLGVDRPLALSHDELLPDGNLLQVRADVEKVWVDWGDGSPPAGYPAQVAFDNGASHPYTIKTCPEDYRVQAPSGWRCHPTLEAYRVRVTFEWVGRYRTGGSWILLGSIERSATRSHDVDEVVGVLIAP